MKIYESILSNLDIESKYPPKINKRFIKPHISEICMLMNSSHS